MIKTILLAGVLGGILMFVWEGIAHEVLPLGEAGIRGLNNEAAVVATLKDNIREAGFYIFPGGAALDPGLAGPQKQEARKKAMEQWKAGPSGIMVVHPEGMAADSPLLLITQCLLDIVVALLAAFLLSLATSLTSYGPRLLFVSLLGLIPTLNAELPYWNFYGFPTTFTMAQGLIHLMGFVVAGLVIAKLVKIVGTAPGSAAAAVRLAA